VRGRARVVNEGAPLSRSAGNSPTIWSSSESQTTHTHISNILSCSSAVEHSLVLRERFTSFNSRQGLFNVQESSNQGSHLFSASCLAPEIQAKANYLQKTIRLTRLLASNAMAGHNRN